MIDDDDDDDDDDNYHYTTFDDNVCIHVLYEIAPNYHPIISIIP